MTFAARLRAAMNDADINQTELAARAGVSKASVSQYLAGRTVPGVDYTKALADATGVSFDYLIGYGEGPKEMVSAARKIRIKDAARAMGKSEQFIRVGLQRGLLPFGAAVPGAGGKWSYYISPGKFKDYIGEDSFRDYFG